MPSNADREYLRAYVSADPMLWGSFLAGYRGSLHAIHSPDTGMSVVLSARPPLSGRSSVVCTRASPLTVNGLRMTSHIVSRLAYRDLKNGLVADLGTPLIWP